MKLDLSPTSWGRVISVTVAGTAFFIAVAFFVDSFNFPYLSAEAVRRAACRRPHSHSPTKCRTSR